MDNEGSTVSNVVAAVDGRGLLTATQLAADWLALDRDEINALNVFPVPDGDTGTNMLLTLREAVTAGEAAVLADTHAGTVASAIARGAFVGARGNSGVILCQMIRGFANAIADQSAISGSDIAAGLAGARDQAYRAVLDPVEGTMLTVISGAAAEAQATIAADPGGLPAAETVLAAAVAGARAALARTPELLDILRQANVVDAGGQGVVRILEGFLRAATGAGMVPTGTEPEATVPLGARMAFLDTVVPNHGDGVYGYCVNFVVLGESRLDVEAARSALSRFGESVEIIGDADALRVHLHTENPGPILGFAVSLGTLDRIQIENMELQTQRLAQQRDVARVASAEPPSPVRLIEVNPDEIAVLAISSGPGLAAALQAMGAGGVIEGGQTMNPSTAELLAGINALGSDQVIILPNNPNIILAAHQVTKLTDREVAVVPSRSVPQGLAALSVFNPKAPLSDNVPKMTRALRGVRTVEITHAIRDAVVDGTDVRKEQAIGFVDERLVAAGTNLVEVAAAAVSTADLQQAELVTIFTGAGVDVDAAAELRDAVLAVAPHLTVEIHQGGQPHYPFVVAVE